MILYDYAQNSDDWYKIRLGKPTSSAASRIITTTGKLSASIQPYAEELAIELIKGGLDKEFTGTRYTQRGHDMEQEAVDNYEWLHDADCTECGFITDEDETIGASPDRLVGKDGILEIKCFLDVKHLESVEKYNKSGKFPPDRIAQTQMQLMITGRKWNDLFFYHPDLKPLRVRTEPDPEFQATLKEGITKLLTLRDEIVRSQR